MSLNMVIVRLNRVRFCKKKKCCKQLFISFTQATPHKLCTTFLLLFAHLTFCLFSHFDKQTIKRYRVKSFFQFMYNSILYFAYQMQSAKKIVRSTLLVSLYNASNFYCKSSGFGIISVTLFKSKNACTATPIINTYLASPERFSAQC